jgi:hypothetical protein
MAYRQGDGAAGLDERLIQNSPDRFSFGLWPRIDGAPISGAERAIPMG